MIGDLISEVHHRDEPILDEGLHLRDGAKALVCFVQPVGSSSNIGSATEMMQATTYLTAAANMGSRGEKRWLDRRNGPFQGRMNAPRVLDGQPSGRFHKP
ncbi:hypothetical protein [Magnetospirillum sp. 15-1]|uniref:hypothetical protein n=1 Tax=Magnetospirillum sp. 15-1 TaxID=1979370 RepID=UPI0011450E78|nr:hypothetical protein [Magnetospirillum sp. 15-1]